MSGYSDQVTSGQSNNSFRDEFTSSGNSSELRGADLQPGSSTGADYTSESTHGLPKVHEGHVSAGSQLPTGQGFTGVDMAAETAKFDNAFGAVPGHQETSSGSYGAVGSGISGTSGSYDQSSTTGFTGGRGSNYDQSNTTGSTGHHHGSSSHSGSHTGGDSYTGNKDEQKEQMAQEKKENAQEKKEELKHRNASGESKMDIAKDEHNKISQEADEETPDGKKPGLMDKIKTAVKKL